MKIRFHHTFLLGLMLVTALFSLVSIPASATDTPTGSDGDLKIKDVKVTADRTENSITWSLSNPASKPTLQYGTNRDVLKDAGTVVGLKNESYKVELKDLSPGTLYYFTIKAITDDNLQDATYNGVLTTRGYPVQLTIKQNDQSLAGAQLKIGSRIFTSNENGIVMAEFPSGKLTASITAPGSKTALEQTFIVKKLSLPDDGDPALQSLSLAYASASGQIPTPASTSLPLIIGLIVAVGGAAALACGLLLTKRKPATQAAVQPTAINTEQLRQNYGVNMERYITNTPEPNLGGGFISSTINTVVTSTSNNTPQPYPLPSSQTAPAVDLATQPFVDTPAPAPQSDPILSTNPSSDTSQSLQGSASPSDLSAAPLENEVLAQDLVRVESSEHIIASEEPSAIYDASTGELDIIHHHETSAPSVAHAVDPSSGTPMNTPTQQGAVG